MTDLQEKFKEALDEICIAYDGGQDCDANEVFARLGLRVVAGDEAVAENLTARANEAALARRQEEDLKLADRYLTDFGMVAFRPRITGAAVRVIEKQLREEVHKRWSAGEYGPWVWSDGAIRQEAADD